jgi:hypothetical protein
MQNKKIQGILYTKKWDFKTLKLAFARMIILCTYLYSKIIDL